MTNEDTTDFDEHFAKISSYIVDTLHGVPLEMTEDEKEQFRIQVISNQYAERLLSEAEKTETYRGLSKIDILHTVSIPQLARTIPLKGLNLSLEKYRMPDGVKQLRLPIAILTIWNILVSIKLFHCMGGNYYGKTQGKQE